MDVLSPDSLWGRRSELSLPKYGKTIDSIKMFAEMFGNVRVFSARRRCRNFIEDQQFAAKFHIFSDLHSFLRFFAKFNFFQILKKFNLIP